MTISLNTYFTKENSPVISAEYLDQVLVIYISSNVGDQLNIVLVRSLVAEFCILDSAQLLRTYYYFNEYDD